MITVGQMKTAIAGKLHGVNFAKVDSVYEKFREAQNRVLSKIDPYTTIRTYTIQNALHDQVYNYTAPDDIKGNNKIIDLRPISPRSPLDEVNATFSKDFDIRKQNNTNTIEVINGIKTLRIAKQLSPRTIICPLDSLTVNATVTSNADITNLDVNYQDHVAGNGAISFDLAGGGQGILKITLANDVDLSRLEDVGALFHWFKFPSSTLTNVKLRWGNDVSNYFEKTVTAPHDRTTFEYATWLLNRYNWQGATETGTVDSTTISYIEIEFNYTGGAKTGVLVNSLTASLGKVYELVYYSNRIFKGVDGTWKETPTLDTDIIMLDPDSENIFLYEAVLIFTQEIQGKDQSSDYITFKKELGEINKEEGLYYEYTQNYPSQVVQQQTTYYNYSSLGADTVGQDDRDVYENDIL